MRAGQPSLLAMPDALDGFCGNDFIGFTSRVEI
jgi:hypothetical protein